MFGLGGLDPKKMQALMSKMGISQKEIGASKVIIEKNDGGKLIINNPNVTKMNVKGNEIFQIEGQVSESAEPEISEEDIKTIMKKTGASETEALKALEKTRDLADAIIELSS